MTTPTMPDLHQPPATSDEARTRLIETLELSLVGPWAGHAFADETLPIWERPSNWYLTGFLIPSDTPADKAADDDEQDEVEAIGETAGNPEETAEDRRAAKRSFFPRSMGLSFLMDPGAASLAVTVHWADYRRAKQEQEGKAEADDETAPDGEARTRAPKLAWQRTPRESTVEIAVTDLTADPTGRDVPDSGGLKVVCVARTVDSDAMHGQVPAGTRSVSVFLVNERSHQETYADEAYAFQPQLVVHADRPFVPRPNLRGLETDEWDEQVADVHYADVPEYASGHGVSVDWTTHDGGCHEVRTAWIPRARVERTVTWSVPDVVLEMGKLGALQDGEAAQAALMPLVEHYRAWIQEQQGTLSGLSAHRRETAEELLRLAEVAADRIKRGIDTLAGDPDALDAFRVANRAVGAALEKRLAEQLDGQPPAWRAFQLAFLLLNMRGMAVADEPDRLTVDLLFFPTGGGKTEAYLGLAAFSMVLRRLRNPGLTGAGVSVMMRYTLRLLTLDQLGRAAGLVCALELEREKVAARYGSWPFEIGLWVGKAATPNRMGSKHDKRPDTARARTIAYKNNPTSKPAPIPIETCPWCGTPFTEQSFDLLPVGADAPDRLQVSCSDYTCDFSGQRGLPILTVDEEIYRRLPSFLVATVDKFATLPWVGESGLLLGGATCHQGDAGGDSDGFFGPATPRRGAPLASPLPSIDLVIQDELHLISGPLGTMAGLYETAIEALITDHADHDGVRPKIVASTATVRRAQDQIQALFARAQTQVFPPAGPDRCDSFFAKTVSPEVTPARMYVGVAAQGRNPKEALRRTWIALMAAAQNLFMDAGGYDQHDNPADPYMTVLGYFNSLRELGGARRILEEQVRNTLRSYGGRRRLNEPWRLFRDRRSWNEVVELTSRVSTDQVAVAKRRLEVPFDASRKDRVDSAIATNMISVGLDISRLGLMVVFGQPKTHAEYIQATSRVGRDAKRPGLVVTLLNVHKPRDRSHFERFRHYHETFYRSVEVSSVTPFSPRALDRGLAGALVSAARHLRPELTPPRGAGALEGVRVDLEKRLLDLFQERIEAQDFEGLELEERWHSVQQRIGDLLDSWIDVVSTLADKGEPIQYQEYETKGPKPLLADMLATDLPPHQAKFRVNRSLRDVEPVVNLKLEELGSDQGGGD